MSQLKNHSKIVRTEKAIREVEVYIQLGERNLRVNGDSRHLGARIENAKKRLVKLNRRLERFEGTSSD